ncbi:DUF4013 domain-containing protein [Methanosphaera sp. Vir-13MRS]|uniref:DUF4013 domain-containing protein n=1 Tax=Candidatus Methanosphaera massiliense TaxID=3017187 RepID=UPI002380A4EA|nr:DUF4013 domain-containing protein [Candidatus Methanosphaera massiliense]MDE4078226.1 DUF4013 domain-containing protein [Candidatus Methanosphaera massiliense]
MIFDILKDGLEYVGTNKNQIILYYIGILLFPLILIESYSYHIIENCMDGMINNKDKLPDITLNTEKIINGLKLLILKTLYFLPEIIIILIAFNLERVDYYTLFTILIVLSLLSYYLSQIATVLMIDNKQFKEGFNFSKIFEIIKSVGITYIEFIIATFIIILGIIGVTLIVIMTIMFLGNFASILINIFIILMIILFFVFLVVMIPSYVLFKNRAIVSIYNLK